MSRFPPLPPSQQSPEQEALHNEIDVMTQTAYGSSFTLKDSDGAFLGPFAPLLYTPSIGSPWLGLNFAVMNMPEISPRERELAIFAVLAHSPAAYAIYAHRLLARKVELSPDQIEDALEGNLPKNLEEKEGATYVLARKLVGMRGSLDGEAFESARKVLGREGVAAVVHTTGLFLYSTVLLNAADVGVPDTEKV